MGTLERLNSETIYTPNVSVSNEKGHYTLLKRSLDLIGSSLGLLLLSPIMIIIALLVKIADKKGSILFRQIRVGKSGEEFFIYKFRTMLVDAEDRLRSNKILYDKYVENGYKLEPYEDPRITKIGKFLRKTSLDELPQLINVFKGEMSLVGPRPVIKEELAEYKDNKALFLSVKPGITGYWQVSGRSEIGYPERVDLELYYVNNKSFLFDIKILFKTVWIVLVQKGAY